MYDEKGSFEEKDIFDLFDRAATKAKGAPDCR